MKTKEMWDKSGKSFHAFISGEDSQEKYRQTLFSQMKEPVEVDEEIYDYYLCALPAIPIMKGFQCSEPVLSDTYDTFTQYDGKFLYHGHGPKYAEWVNLPIMQERLTHHQNNDLCHLLRKTSKNWYPATELAYVLRFLNGEEDLFPLISSDSVEIVKEFYQKEGLSWKQ